MRIPNRLLISERYYHRKITIVVVSLWNHGSDRGAELGEKILKTPIPGRYAPLYNLCYHVITLQFSCSLSGSIDTIYGGSQRRAASSHTGSERAMKTPSLAWPVGFPVRDKIRARLPTRKTEEMHTTHLQLMQLLQLAITSLTSLFAALIAVDGTSRDSRPPGHGKTTCGNDKDALQYYKFSWDITEVMASTIIS